PASFLLPEDLVDVEAVVDGAREVRDELLEAWGRLQRLLHPLRRALVLGPRALWGGDVPLETGDRLLGDGQDGLQMRVLLAALVRLVREALGRAGVRLANDRGDLRGGEPAAQPACVEPGRLVGDDARSVPGGDRGTLSRALLARRSGPSG